MLNAYKLSLVVSTALLLMAVPACDDDTEERSDAGTGQDGTATVTNDGGAGATWTETYALISSRCLPCHANGDGVAQGQLDMSSQATAYANLVNVVGAGAQCAGRGVRVVPGSADGSLLYLKVTPDHSSPCGAKMPLGTDGLSPAESDVIESWIAAGAKDD